MNSQKNKHLNNAQKFIQKGQLDKAAKEYEYLVAVDPNDIRHRQKLAELLARCNRKQDAIREYETVAGYYETNGFYLKSMSVLKQIQKLDSSKIEICLTLAQLNEKQGLIGNALSEYKAVFDHYERLGQTSDAIKILETMHGVDPDNLDIRAKLAETRSAAGMRDLAYSEYTAVADLLRKRGNQSAFARTCARIEALFPEKTGFRLDLLKQQLQDGKGAEVVPQLLALIEKDDSNHEAHLLLADAYRTVGDAVARKRVLQRMVELFPGEASAKGGLIECVAEEGELERSLDLLSLHGQDIAAAGEYERLERVYKALQAQAPYDVRVLNGLKQVYEASGDREKLADVTVSLRILSEGPEDPARGAVAPPEEVSAPDTFSWEEAIELSLPGDDIELTFSTDETAIPADAAELSAGTEGEEPAATEALPWELPSEEMVIESTSLTADDVSLSSGPAEIRGETGGESFDVELDYSFSEIEFEDAPAETTQPETTAPDSWLSGDLPVTAGASGDEPAEEGGSAAEEIPSFDVDLDYSFREIEIEEAPAEPFALPPTDPAPSVSSDAPGCKSEWLDPHLGVESAPDEEVVAVQEGFELAVEEPSADRAEPIRSEENVDRAEIETHYNLGIAYMEMGLLDEAIKELEAASPDPLRGADCLTLKSVCLRDKGEYRKAEETLRSAMTLCGDQQDRLINVKYELAIVLERDGRCEEALQLLREVFLADPGFRDTAAMMSSLSRKSSGLDFSELDQLDIELEEMK